MELSCEARAKIGTVSDGIIVHDLSTLKRRAAKELDTLPQDARKQVDAGLHRYAMTGQGNVKTLQGRNGECIYHEPGSRWYSKVNMDRGERKQWFCSVQQAEAAGCRAAKN